MERRLLNRRGNPSFNVSFYIVSRKGDFAGVALYGEDEDERGWAGQNDGRLVRYAVCTENGPEILPCDPLLEGVPTDE